MENVNNDVGMSSDRNDDVSNTSQVTGGAEDILQRRDGTLVECSTQTSAQSKVPKDSKQAWLKCACAFILQVTIVGILHMYGVFFLAFIRDFSTNKAVAAWVGSLAYGLCNAFAPIASASVTQFGVRFTLCAGSAICLLSLMLSSIVSSLEWMFLTFSVLYGLGTSLAYSPTMTIADDYFSKYLSVATGITVSGTSFGTLIFNPLGQSLVDFVGWRNAMRILSFTSVIGFIAGLTFEGRPIYPQTAAERVKKTPVKWLVAELHLWKNKVYVIWVLAITLAMFGYYVPYVHLVSHAEDLGISRSKSSMLMLAMGASTATGRIMFGKIITFGVLDRLHMQQLSMVITGLACMMLPLIKTFPGLITYVICVGLVDGCFIVMLPLLTLTLAGVENKVTAWGYLIGISSITFMLGPPVAGWIYEATGSYDLAFQLAAISILLGHVALLFIPWAQRTANTANDALSVAGDVDTEPVSSVCSIGGTSIMSAWAAPPRSQISSMRSLTSHTTSIRGSTSHRKTPSIDIHDLHLTVPSSRHKYGDDGLTSTPQESVAKKAGLVCATSLDAEWQHAHRVAAEAAPKGRRCRSVSESTDDRQRIMFTMAPSGAARVVGEMESGGSSIGDNTVSVPAPLELPSPTWSSNLTSIPENRIVSNDDEVTRGALPDQVTTPQQLTALDHVPAGTVGNRILSFSLSNPFSDSCISQEDSTSSMQTTSSTSVVVTPDAQTIFPIDFE